MEKELTIVVFGGTGDLMKRKLMPAFANLCKKGIISKDSLIVGVGRRDFNNEDYKKFLFENANDSDNFVNLPIHYYKTDIAKAESEDLSDLKDFLNLLEIVLHRSLMDYHHKIGLEILNTCILLEVYPKDIVD